MTNSNNTPRFTAPNICAVLRAVPESDGTYHDVIRKISEYGVTLSPSTLGKCISNGRADIKANKRQTAYARFALKFDQLKREHCTADASRNREFDLALKILENTCDCGEEKVTLPNGSLGDACRRCQDLENQGRPGNRRKRRPPSTACPADPTNLRPIHPTPEPNPTVAKFLTPGRSEPQPTTGDN